jgi:hypothetical protein
MPLTVPQLRSLKTLLVYAFEQTEESQNIVSSVLPRTSKETHKLRRLKNIGQSLLDEIDEAERAIARAARQASYKP